MFSLLLNKKLKPNKKSFHYRVRKNYFENY